jgi:hypothetical protein
MPDISMCQNLTCQKKETCYRFTATPSTYQWYAGFKPDEKGECKYYIPNKKKESNG